MPAGWGVTRSGPVAVLIAAIALASAGCAGSPSITSSAALHPAATPHASSASTGQPPSDGPIAPLTGLSADSARAAGRPAVALPVTGDRPHGLAAADVVFEEITTPVRYVAVFQSHQQQPVGPVTGTRPTDGQVLSVLHPLLGYDGGTLPFIRVLDRTDVVDVGAGRYPSLYRPGTAGPTVSTGQLERAARSTAPPPLFTYQGTGIGQQEQFASTGTWRVSWLRIKAAGLGTQQWVFSPRSDRWTEVAGGPRVQVANLIVQTVPYKAVNLNRRAGLTVPSARVIGTGHALVLSAAPGTTAGGTGVAVHTTWSKPGRRQVTNYLDARGVPVGLQPGSTWVVLAPRGAQISTGRGRA